MTRTGPLTVSADVRPPGRVRSGRVGWPVAVVAGAVVIAVGGDWWSVVAAMTLGYAAATDWLERRVPRWSVRIGALGVGLLVVAESWRLGDWSMTLRAVGMATLALAGLGGLWWRSPETIGFGDVKAVALALGAAAAVSWRAAANVLVVTAWAGLAVAVWFVVRRRRAGGSGAGVQRRAMTVPFVPALCVGFIVGVAS